MIRPDIALTGINDTLSAHATSDLEHRAPHLLARVRHTSGADIAVKAGLALSVVLALSGALTGTATFAWVGAAFFAGSLALLALNVRRAAAAFAALADTVRTDYGAKLLTIHRDDVAVSADGTLLRALRGQ